MPALVRPAADAELEEVGRLTVAAFRAVPGPPVSDGYLAVLAGARARAGDAPVLVAADDEVGALLGAVTYVPDERNPHAEHLRPGEASMRYLAVDPAAQRRGAARLLVRWCTAQAAADGRRRVFIHSSEHMAAAHALYESLGFVRVVARDWQVLPDLLLYGYALDLQT